MRILAVLLCLALPAQAQGLPLPALFDVGGVAADDVLNVRDAPRATAGIVAEMRPDATAIEILRLSESGDWGLTNVGEGTGWASMRFLTRRSGQGWQVPPAIAACSGTEPFWSLDPVDALTFRVFEDAADIAAPTWTRAAGRTDPWGLIAQTTRGPLHGILSRQSCSDGMSDRESGLRIDLIAPGGDVYTGCCTLTP